MIATLTKMEFASPLFRAVSSPRGTLSARTLTEDLDRVGYFSRLQRCNLADVVAGVLRHRLLYLQREPVD